MIQLTPYQNTHYEALASYQLTGEQAQFTAPISYCIHERKDLQDEEKTVVTICYAEQPVGFFVLDSGADKCKVTDNPRARFIRALSINPSYQGKGIGKEAMRQVADFAKQHCPLINELTLSVNVKNLAAYHAYLKSHFIDTGKTIDDPMGAQHVLTQSLT